MLKPVIPIDPHATVPSIACRAPTPSQPHLALPTVRCDGPSRSLEMPARDHYVLGPASR